MSYLGKSYHPPGTAPGTLDDRQRGEIEIRLVDYDGTDYVERTLERAEDCTPYLDRVSRTWIQVNGRPDADTLRSLGRLFDLHELALEDVLNTGQRPKMDIFDDQLFIVLAMPRHEDGSVVQRTGQHLRRPRLPDLLLDHGAGSLRALRKRMRPPSTSRLRSQGIDYLLYGIVDFVIDAAFPVLEEFGVEIEELEELLLASPGRDALARIHHVRRELLLLQAHAVAAARAGEPAAARRDRADHGQHACRSCATATTTACRSSTCSRAFARCRRACSRSISRASATAPTR